MLGFGADFPILLSKILGISGENILTIFMFLSQKSPDSFIQSQTLVQSTG